MTPSGSPLTRPGVGRRVLVVLLVAAALLTARDGSRDGSQYGAERLRSAQEAVASVTSSPASVAPLDAPSSATHAGAASHSANGIIADDLTALREEEWQWVRRAAEVGEKVAFAEMVKAYDSDPKNSPHCHQLVHELGRQSYSRHKSLATALSFENNFCGGGFSHGVFEAWGRDQNVIAETSNLSATCDALETNPGACGHGIGHAIMQGAPSLADAVKLCTGLAEQYQWPCIDGVTMMYAMSFLAPSKDDPRPDKGFNIKEFCRLIPGRFAERCEFGAGALWLGVTDHEDRAVALRQCLLLDRDALAPQRCGYGIGETVLDQTSWDTRKIFTVCRSGPDETAAWCAESALRNLARVAREAGRPDPCAVLEGADLAFCRRAVVSQDRRASSFSS